MKRKIFITLCAAVMAVSILLCDNSISVVKADTVDDTQTTESTETTAFTVKKYKKAITRYVKAGRITTYAKPTTSSKKKGALAYGTKLNIVGKVTTYKGKKLSPNWYQLDTGVYISSKDVSATKGKLVTTKSCSKKTLYAGESGIKLREYPSTSKTKTIITIGEGDEVTKIAVVKNYKNKKTSGTWYKITYKAYNGKSYTGYVKSTCLTTEKPDLPDKIGTYKPTS
jgi:hypothetical protein